LFYSFVDRDMLTRFTGMGNIGHHSQHSIDGPQLPNATEERHVNDDEVEDAPVPGQAADPTGDEDDIEKDGEGDWIDDDGEEDGDGDEEEEEDEFDPEVGQPDDDDDNDDNGADDGGDDGDEEDEEEE
jgi:hypothetical protein